MKSWMRNLPEELKNKPLNRLCIPGSHDTGAYKLHSDLPLAHDQSFPRFIRTLSKLKPFRRFIRRWSETQGASITTQLKMGIRYLDIRIELVHKKEGDTKPYLVHGLYGEANISFMHEIKNFMDENKEEIVILDINHIYEMSESDFVEYFVEPIENVFGRDLFCPSVVDIGNCTINELIESNHRLIVVGPFNHNLQGIVFGNSNVVSCWPNVNKIPDLMHFMKTEIDKPETEHFHVLQGVLTAKKKDIIKHPLSSLKNTLSIESRDATIDFLNLATEEERARFNIVITDQINEKFVKICIEQNLKF